MNKPVPRRVKAIDGICIWDNEKKDVVRVGVQFYLAIAMRGGFPKPRFSVRYCKIKVGKPFQQPKKRKGRK